MTGLLKTNVKIIWAVNFEVFIQGGTKNTYSFIYVFSQNEGASMWLKIFIEWEFFSKLSKQLF